MNRQIRRVEEKKERKAEKEKAKAKADRQKRRRERIAQRKRAAAPRADKDAARDGAKERQEAAGPRRSNPGRFAGALTAATVFFIALQAVAPTDGTIPSQIVSASFYLLFGYFSVLWMMRRGSARPIAIAVGTAAAMGVVTFLSQWLQPALEPAPLMLALILPLAVGGAFLGRLVWNRAP